MHALALSEVELKINLPHFQGKNMWRRLVIHRELIELPFTKIRNLIIGQYAHCMHARQEDE